MLRVKKLDPNAVLPTVAHKGEDLAYDLYALQDTFLKLGRVTKIRTGIAAQAVQPKNIFEDPVGLTETSLGLLVRDRSSMAAEGITVIGGVIDAGYTGEICVLMCLSFPQEYICGHQIKSGDKIAQMIPIPILTGDIVEVEELSGQRGDNGFGSTGR